MIGQMEEAPTASLLQPLLIGAPFGNYLHFPGSSPVHGSFTAHPRPGIVAQLFRTFRPLPRRKGWVNRLGLRNPSLALASKLSHPHALVSLAALSADEWLSHAQVLEQKLTQEHWCFGAIELNLSCPNADILEIDPDSLAALAALKPLVAKLSARRHALSLAEKLYNQGIRIFHLTNTLKTPSGGISGAPLRPYAIAQIQRFRSHFGDQVHLIGGGGIQTASDMKAFVEAGANTLSVASACLAPWRLPSLEKEARRLCQPLKL